MRHRIAVIGSSTCTRMIARQLVERDDSHVLLTAEDGGPLRALAESAGAEPRVDGPVAIEDITAAHVVVVCDGQTPPAAELGRRCPSALLVVATSHPAQDGRQLQDELRWPRQRVIGIDATAAGGDAQQRATAAVRLVDHLLADRGRTLEATVQTTAQGGPGSWASVPVRVGAVGLQSISAAPATAGV